MAGRLAIGVAMTACLLTAGSLDAQGPAYVAAPTVVAPNPYSAAAPYGPASDGSSSPGAIPNGLSGPGGGGCQQCGHVYRDGNGINVTCDVRGEGADEVLEPTPLEEAFCRIARNATFNLDYINWGISRPNTTLIGINPGLQTLNPLFESNFLFPFVHNGIQKNPTDFFPIFNSNGDEIGFGRSYDTTSFSLSGNSGFKGTLSVPLTFGTAEITGFILGNADTSSKPGGLPQGTPGVSTFDVEANQLFAAVGVTVNGQSTGKLLLFSQSFGSTFDSQVFGGEFNLVGNPIVPKDYGLLIMPLVGFRYLGVNEQFEFSGSNPGMAVSTTTSQTISNIFGPQVGCRFELVTQWFSVGVDPRVMLGVNQMVANVDSFDPQLGSAHDRISTARFSAVGALDVYAKIPIHDHVKLYVAYNLIGTGDISRPQEQIDYNVRQNGNGGFSNDFHLDLAHSALLIQGYSVGAEINF